MSRVCFWLVGLVLVPSLGLAQQQVVVTVDGPGGGGVQIMQQIGPGGPGMPPRDPGLPAKAGTATLRGRVVAAESGQPLRKAQVRITAGDIRENRLTSTDADGKYEFTNVVAGRYNVMANKGSYVGLQYGQQRPFEPGKPLEILDGQLVEKVDFALPRGGIVTGRVIDEFGEPLADAMVSMQRYANFNGQRRLVPAGRSATTNDIGEFRLFAIPPGQYYLSATMRMVGVGGETDDRSGYAPTYFPGTTNMAEAQKVTIGLGQVLSDMNMALLPTRTSRITGTVVDSQGRPFSGMVMTVPRGDSMMMMFGPPSQTKPDGSFTIGGLAPGRYMLQARSMGAMGGDAEAAYLDLTVSGEDINGLKLVTARPSTASGRVIVDPAAASALRPSAITLSLQSVEPDMFMFGLMPAKVTDDLTFEIKAAPGRARIAMMGQAPGWAIRAVRYRGIDVTDSGIEFRPNEDVGDIEVELTNRISNVSGLVTNTKGETLKDYSVVVFSADREKWTPNSRYMRTARPDQEGRYKVNGLPPGEYRVIALDYVDPNEWNTSEFLEGIRNKATPLSINEGETKSVDLRITTSS